MRAAGQPGRRLPTGLRRNTLGLERIRIQIDYVFAVVSAKYFILNDNLSKLVHRHGS